MLIVLLIGDLYAIWHTMYIEFKWRVQGEIEILLIVYVPGTYFVWHEDFAHGLIFQQVQIEKRLTQVFNIRIKDFC